LTENDTKVGECWGKKEAIQRAIREVREPQASLTLLPPGTRKNNRFWMVRGTLRDRRRIEVSSKTTDETQAKRFARDLAARFGSSVTYDRLAETELSHDRGVVIELARNPKEMALIRKWIRR
jgi:hypothetical protein